MNLFDVVNKPHNLPTSQNEKQRRMCPVATDTNVKPIRPNGHLDRTPFYKKPWSFLVDTKNDILMVKKGVINGTANDHELGRINALAMKIGGLALASYLASRTSGASKKAMEYVGSLTFISSMFLWPKLFIELPIKFLYGVPIMQRYVDAQGRKKMFFQDPQYVPWDLYTPKEMNKLGDKLGVPKNIYNRDEVIKNTAQKVALQGNTLWMLSAGFATPLLTALMCSAMEEKVGSLAINTKTFKQRYNIEEINKIVNNQMKNYSNEKLEDLLNQYKGKSPEEIKMEIAELMRYDCDFMHEKLLFEEMDRILAPPKDIPRHEILKAITQFNDIEQPRKNGIPKITNQELEKLYKDYPNIKEFKRAYKLLLHSRNADEWYMEVALNLFEAEKNRITTPVLDEKAINKLIMLDKMLKVFNEKKYILDDLAKNVMLSSGISEASIKWQKMMKSLSEILRITSEDLTTLRDRNSNGLDLIYERMEKIAKDEKEYEKTVEILISQIVDLDERFIPKTQDLKKYAKDGFLEDLKSAYSDICSRHAAEMRKHGFDKYAETLSKTDEFQGGTIHQAVSASMENKILAVRGSIGRLLSALDILKRLNNPSEFEARYKRIIKQVTINGKMSITLDEARNMVRKMAFEASNFEHAAKFDLISRAQYALIMRLAFDSPLDETTEKTIQKLYGNKGLDKLIGYNKNMIDIVGNFINSNSPLLIAGKTPKSTGDALWDRRLNEDHVKRGLQVGPLFANVFKDASEEIMNNKRWIRLYGGAFIGLVGTTLLAQLFFGKMRKNEVYITKKEK